MDKGKDKWICGSKYNEMFMIDSRECILGIH